MIPPLLQYHLIHVKEMVTLHEIQFQYLIMQRESTSRHRQEHLQCSTPAFPRLKSCSVDIVLLSTDIYFDKA